MPMTKNLKVEREVSATADCGHELRFLRAERMKSVDRVAKTRSVKTWKQIPAIIRLLPAF